MGRRLTVLVLALGVLAAVPSANAAYPVPYAMQGGDGLLSKDGMIRFVAADGVGHASTVLTVMSRSDNSTLQTVTLDGSFGIPQLTYQGPSGGLFRDGSAFVLESMGFPKTSRFLVIGTDDLAI